MIGRLVSRLRAHALLAVALAIGLSMFFGLIALVPIYTAAASTAVLAELAAEDDEQVRPQFAYFFSTDGDGERQRWDPYRPVTDYLLGQARTDLNLEIETADVRLLTRRFETVATGGQEVPIGPRALTSVDNFDRLAVMTAGRRPTPGSGPGPLSVAISADLAAEQGLAPGDPLVLLDDQVPADASNRTLEAVVAGVWEPIDADDTRWIVHPSSLADQLVVARADIVDLVDPGRPPTLDRIQWYLVGSGDAVTPRRVDDILTGRRTVTGRVEALAPDISLLLAPDELLNEYQRRTDELSRSLNAYSVPGALIVGLFVLLVMGFNVDQRRAEMAVLRSRGAPIAHALTSVASELAVVGLVSLAAGVVVAFAFVAVMVRTRTFLSVDFGADGPTFWRWSDVPLAVLLVTAAMVLAVQVIMLVGPARRTIVAHRSGYGNLGRAVRGTASLWDVAVVAAVVALVAQRTQAARTVDGFDDPWVVALPAAVALAVGLVLLRFVPRLASLMAGVLGRSGATSLFLAAQRLSKSPRPLSGPLLLMVIATGLAAFLASLSLTLERQLVDETYLANGADHVVVEITGPGLSPTPIERYRNSPKVAAATGTVELAARFGDAARPNNQLQLVAVDPQTFATAAHWQDAYDDQTLAKLLAGLQAAPEQVIISRDLARRFDVGIGDRIRYAIAAGDDFTTGTVWLETNGTVSGITERFPRWVGEDREPLIIINRSFLETQVGVLGRSTTLIRLTDPSTAAGFDTGTFQFSAAERIATARAQPIRQGVFGILTATFISATVVALLSLVLQSLFSYRERSIESGVLRALGLPFRSLAALVSFDFVLMGLLGVLTGSITGVAMSRWLVPDLAETAAAGGELDGDAHIAWLVTGTVAAMFAFVIVAVVSTLVPLLRRLKIFQAIKLGESL